jgi:16S rRNA (adenine1518-N6/adenine1519-N6)-dimethyltransferase
MRHTPKLGQHFLTGSWAARKLVASVPIHAGDAVLEIGPGKGALTKELLAAGARVIAIEKDEDLVAQLQETFAHEIQKGTFILAPGDVRDLDLVETRLPKAYILAANIPYYITGEIIRAFLSSDHQPKTMSLLVQKEVADRILARNKKESILSISVKIFGDPEIAAKVSRGNFSPPPSVDSAILVIRGISKKQLNGINEEAFFRVVRAGFASKRKFLLSNLAKEFGRKRAEVACAAAQVLEKARAEDLSLPQWKTIALELSRYDDRLDRNEAIVRRACEAKEPLACMARRTELIGFGGWCPYILPASRRPNVGIDRIVVAENDLAYLAAEGKRKGRQRSQNQYRGTHGEGFAHATIVPLGDEPLRNEGGFLAIRPVLRCTLSVWNGYACILSSPAVSSLASSSSSERSSFWIALQYRRSHPVLHGAAVYRPYLLLIGVHKLLSRSRSRSYKAARE